MKVGLVAPRDLCSEGHAKKSYIIGLRRKFHFVENSDWKYMVKKDLSNNLPMYCYCLFLTRESNFYASEDDLI